ncbi:hypothetical protein BU24DRAFT_481590 [Aaosphaeria arxii CBS 175.79]|uniref:DUF4038 domain-containing protein n=1 Tax=Aaosphaeria arxii CBS 175.79 TaxID=1450172 RepID=A0A6A5XMY8_9PLEO|nr:uncharacterized protein BU24DRAFT_481590 [Aaosphaeria arxii CBS 175.79]KAF2014171.1 hypothetical protein BU24DRAFT_481590 [Aaosphaeria arxii CBS 175.79]
MVLSAIAFFSSVLYCTTVLAAPNQISYGLKPNDRFFATSDGKPFFWQADTAWLLYQNLNLTEAKTYIDDRATKGFTVILTAALFQEGLKTPNRQGDLPFINQDFSKPNEPYWQHVDTVIEYAWQKQVRIALVPAWGNLIHTNDNLPGPVNQSNAFDFGQWIGKRYPGLPKMLVGDTNPYWMNKTAVKANYALGGAYPAQKVTDFSDVYEAQAAGLVSGEGKGAMITIHCTNQWFEGGPLALASSFFGHRSWLTFDTSQSGHSDFPPNPPIPWWNARRGYEPVEIMYKVHQKRPILDNEPHYEGRYNNAKQGNAYWNASNVRIGSYQAVFSGASGVTYGSDNVWQMYIPGLSEPTGSGPTRSWAEDISLPGSSQIQYVKKVILDRKSYFTRVPAQEIIIGDNGSGEEHVTATIDGAGGFILVFTPISVPFTISTTSLRSRRPKASWYNPLNGEYMVFALDGSLKSTETFTPPTAPDHSDWVLVLEG